MAVFQQGGFNPNSDLVYDGTYTVMNDGDGHWRIKLLTGVASPQSMLRFLADPGSIDIFLVGGGSGGGPSGGSAAGGAGGYTTTAYAVPIQVGVDYPIIVGAGGALNTAGAASSAFGFSATGGAKAPTAGANVGGVGASGGSGGAGGDRGTGGSNGSNGGAGTYNHYSAGGTGQGTTTREFGEVGGTLYSGGGGSYNGGIGGDGGGGNANVAGAANTGGGGGFGAAGGSGIVVIRDHRA